MAKHTTYPIGPQLKITLRKNGITPKLYRYRLWSGWTQQRASTEPVGQKNKGDMYTITYYSGNVMKSRQLFSMRSVANWLTKKTGETITKNMIVGKFNRPKRPVMVKGYKITRNTEKDKWAKI